MTTSDETQADILAEMRQHIQAARDFPHDIEITTGDVEDWADRIEAACARGTGNTAAMRDALEQVQSGFDNNVLGPIGDIPNDWEIDEAKRLSKVVDSALASPPRNCDVGTADEQEERFKHYCGQHYSACDVDAECFRCPLASEKTSCEFAWAQMPYEAEGGAE